MSAFDVLRDRWAEGEEEIRDMADKVGELLVRSPCAWETELFSLEKGVVEREGEKLGMLGFGKAVREWKVGKENEEDEKDREV